MDKELITGQTINKISEQKERSVYIPKYGITVRTANTNPHEINFGIDTSLLKQSKDMYFALGRLGESKKDYSNGIFNQILRSVGATGISMAHAGITGTANMARTFLNHTGNAGALDGLNDLYAREKINKEEFEATKAELEDDFKNAEKRREEWSISQQEQLNRFLAAGGLDKTQFDGFTYDLFSGVGSVAAAFAVGALTKSPAAVMSMFGIIAGQQNYNEALAAGVKGNKALALGLTTGIIEGGLEAIGTEWIFRAVTKAGIGQKSIRQIIQDLKGEGALGIAKAAGQGFISEGLQEGSQSLAQSIIMQGAGVRELDAETAIQDALYEGLIGSLVGGGMSGIGRTGLALASKLEKLGVPPEAAKKAALSTMKAALNDDNITQAINIVDQENSPLTYKNADMAQSAAEFKEVVRQLKDPAAKAKAAKEIWDIGDKVKAVAKEVGLPEEQAELLAKAQQRRAVRFYESTGQVPGEWFKTHQIEIERAAATIKDNPSAIDTLNQPMLPGIDIKQKVNILDLSGYIFNNKTGIKEQLKVKLNSLVGQKLETQTQDRLVDILNKNKQHIINSSRRDFLVRNRETRERHSKAVLNIDSLINNSVLIETVKNTKEDKKPNVDFYHYFYTPVKLGDNTYTIKLVAEQMKGEEGLSPESVHLYDVIEVQKSTPRLSGTKSRLGSAEYTISIAEMLSGVKDTDGNPYIQETYNQSAYHGSPFHFDKFSLEHIGRGEGAQAYGWGLYFAGRKEVGEWYKNKLSDKEFFYKGKKATEITEEEANKYLFLKNKSDIYSQLDKKNLIELVFTDGKQKAIKYKEERIIEVKKELARYKESAQKAGQEYPLGAFLASIKTEESELAFLKDIEESQIKAKGGKLYEVDIPEDNAFLDWDKPFNEQHDNVKKIIEENFAGEVDDFDGNITATGRDIYKDLEIILGSPQKTSEFLNEHGIKGIKYLDGSSRSKGKGGYNYVIFDDSAINILETYDQAAMQNNKDPRAQVSFTPQGALIRLLEGSDPSSIIHEISHIFLKDTEEIARYGRENGWESEDAAQLYQDIVSFLGEPDANGKFSRAQQEIFAKAGEAYIMQGKAPSADLQNVFEKFAAWLAEIYQDVKDFINISPEVSNIFDRLLTAENEAAADSKAFKGRASDIKAIAEKAKKGEAATINGMGIKEVKTLLQQLNSRRPAMPKEDLLKTLKRKGADFDNAAKIDKEAYQNAGIKNDKTGIQDDLSTWLADNGYMEQLPESLSYEEKSRLEEQAADLIDRALSGEKIYKLEDIARLDAVQNFDANIESIREAFGNNISAAEETLRAITDLEVKGYRVIGNSDIDYVAQQMESLETIKEKEARLRGQIERLTEEKAEIKTRLERVQADAAQKVAAERDVARINAEQAKIKEAQAESLKQARRIKTALKEELSKRELEGKDKMLALLDDTHTTEEIQRGVAMVLAKLEQFFENTPQGKAAKRLIALPDTDWGSKKLELLKELNNINKNSTEQENWAKAQIKQESLARTGMRGKLTVQEQADLEKANNILNSNLESKYLKAFEAILRDTPHIKPADINKILKMYAGFSLRIESTRNSSINSFIEAAQKKQNENYKKYMAAKIDAMVEAGHKRKDNNIVKGKYDYAVNTLFSELSDILNISRSEAWLKLQNKIAEMEKAEAPLTEYDKLENMYLTYKASKLTADEMGDMKADLNEAGLPDNIGDDQYYNISAELLNRLFTELNDIRLAGLEQRQSAMSLRESRANDERADFAAAVRGNKPVGVAGKLYASVISNWESLLNLIANNQIKEKYSLLNAESDAEIYTSQNMDKAIDAVKKALKTENIKEYVAGLDAEAGQWENRIESARAQQQSTSERVRKSIETINCFRKLLRGHKACTLNKFLSFKDNTGAFVKENLTFIVGNEKEGLRHIANDLGLDGLQQIVHATFSGMIIKNEGGKLYLRINNDLQAVLEAREFDGERSYVLTGYKITNPAIKPIKTDLTNMEITGAALDIAKNVLNPYLSTLAEPVMQKLTKGELMTLYIWNKNELGASRLENQYGEQLDDMFSRLTREDMLIANAWQKLAESGYPEINKVFVKEYGLDLGKNMAYFPFRAERMTSELDLLKESYQESFRPGMSKSRIISNLIEMKPENPLKILYEHERRAGQYIKTAEQVLWIRKILRDTSLKKIMTDHLGENVTKTVYELLDNSTMGLNKKNVQHYEDGVMNWISNNYIKSAIAAKPTIALKQLISIINYSENMPAAEWAAGFTKGIINCKETIKFMMSDPYLKVRFENGSQNEALMHALARDFSKNKVVKKLDSWSNLMTINVKLGDIGAIIFGGKPYVDYLIKTKGMTKEAAFTKFRLDTLRSQQASVKSSLSRLQAHDMNWLTRALFAFKNTNNQYMRKMVDAIVMYKRGEIDAAQLTKTIAVYGVINQYLYVAATSLGLLSLGLSGGDDKDDALNELFMWFPQNFGVLPILDDAVNQASYTMINLIREGKIRRLRNPELPIFKDIYEAINSINKDDLTFADWVNFTAPIGQIATGLPVKYAFGGLTAGADMAQGKVVKAGLKAAGYTDNRAAKATGEKK